MNRAHYEDTQLIAVVGMACRFPGASTPEAFWENLAAGVCSIRTFSDEELLAAGVAPTTLADPDYVKAAPVLADIADFDAAYFGMTPREAQIMDPQKRLLLECCHEALETAGWDSHTYPGRIGIYAGIGLNSYLLENLLPRPELIQAIGENAFYIANGPDFTTTQISYHLNLTGPSVNLSNACSTSLVAIHESCKSLLAFESDMALAGGATVKARQTAGYLYVPDGVRAADGVCRAFDAAAGGTVFGSGAGVVLLKRAEDALADGDTVHAMILGSAVNNDGSRKMGFTAPSVKGQVDVIADAMAVEEVDPETIGYIEAHGTGTVLGDPIEIAALTQVYRGHTDKTGYCALGSLKTNVGHLDTAAGVAGFIKAVLALAHGQLPPSLHFATPNPKINFAGSPFYVNTELRDWPAGSGPRRAAVSSFGIGGTNAHVVLEAYTPPATLPSRRPARLLMLSAKNARALQQAAARLADHLRTHPRTSLDDAAYTLQVGRRRHLHRGFVVSSDPADAVARLTEGEGPALTEAPEQAPPVVFLLPGQGAQFVGMGQSLYAHEPVFRDTLDTCAHILRPHLDVDLIDLLYPQGDPAEAATRLARTCYTQPAVFAVSYAYAMLWQSWGVRPEAMLGHSLGEYVAACLAGVFSLEDALLLVAKRGALIDALPSGAMLAAPLSPQQVADQLPEGVRIAAVNAANRCVLSGPHAAIEALAAHFSGGIRLQTSHAFHSPMMDAAVAPFQACLAGIRLHEPTLPFVSNLTGTWITKSQATDIHYWTRHLVETVRFAQGLETLLLKGRRVLLEVGPGRSLSGLAGQNPSAAKAVIVPSSRQAKQADDDHRALLTAVGKLWSVGVEIDWQVYYEGEQRRRIPLPTYAFQKQRHWIDAPAGAGAPGMGFAPVPQAPVAAEVSDEQGAAAADTPATPTDPIHAIWADLLGLVPPSEHTSFFDLGGDSLLATQMLSRLRQQLPGTYSLDQFFEAPTIAGLRALSHAEAPAEDTVIPLASRDAPLLLSHAQKRLWIIDSLGGVGSAYHIPSALRLRGRLDVDLLRVCLNRIIARHEVLRTSFTLVDREPRQVVHARAPIALPLVGLPVGTTDAQLTALIRETADLPFDLAEGPLVRAVLYRRHAADHVLFICMHHIISDGWSLGILTRELCALYRAGLEGGDDGLKPLALQYADYSVWQRQWLESAENLAQLAYWRDCLSDLPPLLELPTDAPRPKHQSYQGGVVAFSLSKDQTEALIAFGRDRGATLFISLMAVFQTLLYRYSGQADFAVGTPIANRMRASLEDLIGCFVNTLVIRSETVGGLSFADLLARVRERALGAYAHQDVPFERVVDALQPERNPGHSPLFQVMFILQNTPGAAMELPDLSIDNLRMDKHMTLFDLTLVATDTGDGLRLDLEYNADLFRPETVRRMSRHFLMLLDGALAAPQQDIQRLPLLTAEEQETMLTTWNRTDAPVAGICLHHFLEAGARRTPDRIAAVYQQEQLTYGELNARADRLAAALQQRGASPEVPVGICLPRSMDLLVALLAVLKTGSCYVPLDPDYPAQRLAMIGADVGMAFILAAPGRTARFDGVEVPLLDIDGPAGEGPDAPWKPVAVSPAHAAYIIYTSGSTGKPKGVRISHGAAVNFLESMAREPGLEADDVLLAVTTISFDIAALELYLPLVVGARVVIASAEEAGNALLLQRALNDHGATVMQATPATWRMLAATEWAGLPKILCGGEALPRDLAEILVDKAPSVWNMYGPTETTIWSAVHRVLGPVRGASAPIGRPIANTGLYVLDPHLQPVPIGVPGQLFITGQGLARGYHGLPGMTADRLVPHPFAPAPGARAYRTGDLVRFLPDGTLEFLRRMDEQVKIRGFRIEIGEIEAVIRQDAWVDNVRVVVREDRPGIKQLVGYVQPAASADGAVLTARLQAGLKQALPAYMVPTALVVLERLPLTPNGKIDRKALPKPPRKTAEERAPQTAVEQLLMEIWCEVLALDAVGVDENFFALGGDSILGIQVITRAGEKGLLISPNQLFESQTIAELAPSVRFAPVVRAEQAPITGTAPLVPIQRRFFDLASPEAHHFNQALLFRPAEPMDPDLLRQAFQQVVRHHDVLRVRFTDTPTGMVQVFEPTSEPRIEVLDRGNLDAAAYRETITREGTLAQTRFNLATGPLSAAVLFRHEGEGDRLLLICHHLVVDGVSWRFLLHDLCTVYAQLRDGEPVRLPPKSSSYKTWAERLAAHAHTPQMKSEQAYWATQLAPVDLPADRLPVAPPVQAQTDDVVVQLPEDLSGVLFTELPQAFSSRTDEVLLAALVPPLRDWIGGEGVVLELEDHGRENLFDDVDLSRTCGWFTAYHPFHLAFPRDRDPVGILKAVKEDFRQIPRGGIGYGILEPHLEPHAKPRMCFNYLGRMDQVLTGVSFLAPAEESPGPTRAPAGRLRFDLEINAFVQGGCLHVKWTYAREVFHHHTIERLAAAYRDALIALITHSGDTAVFTPSDFPEMDFDQEELDFLMTEFDE